MQDQSSSDIEQPTEFALLRIVVESLPLEQPTVAAEMIIETKTLPPLDVTP